MVGGATILGGALGALGGELSEYKIYDRIAVEFFCSFFSVSAQTWTLPWTETFNNPPKGVSPGHTGSQRGC